MKKLLRFGLLAILAFALIQPIALFAPSAFAGAAPASTTKIKKRKKHKKNKEVILKGRHGKRSRKPA